MAQAKRKVPSKPTSRTSKKKTAKKTTVRKPARTAKKTVARKPAPAAKAKANVKFKPAKIELAGVAFREADDDLFESARVQVYGLQQSLTFLANGYASDAKPEEFASALRNILSAKAAQFQNATTAIYEYYQDVATRNREHGFPTVAISGPKAIWQHIEWNEGYIERRFGGDKAVYVSFDCSCDWEQEHGLQVVFRHGSELCKVGMFDSHLTNSDAFAEKKFESVIYVSRAMLLARKKR